MVRSDTCQIDRIKLRASPSPRARYPQPVALLDVIVGYDCNLACTYCTITPEMRARSLSPQAIVNEMRAARVRDFDRISFTGGEPTIRGDLIGLIHAAARLGFRDVKVQSNGLLFASMANVERLVDAGVTTFAVSIHTHERAAYERMVRRAGAYDAMVQGLDNLVARGVAPWADVIITTETAPRLARAIAWLAERGVERADLWFVSLTDGNRDNLESMPKMTEVMPDVRAAFAVADAHGVLVRSLHLPRCVLGADADRAFDPAAERVRVVSPDAAFDLSESRITPQRHVPACDGCTDRARCRGVRPDYLERYGDAEIAALRGVPSSIAPSRTLRVVP